MFRRKKAQKEAEEWVKEYLAEHPEALQHFTKVIQIYTDRCYDVKRMRKFLERNPITKAFAEALYEYKEVQVRSGKRGLEDIVIDKDNPEVYKVDPYVASTIAAVGEMLKKGKR